ncbi:MAG: hypothetical protein M3157_06840 [Actinomycetota bacterium]|nr:hypothetical protein [Actinomycetota bacterium]
MVVLGVLLALGVGALVVFGIAWPIFEHLLSAGLASTAVPTVIVVFAAAFAFYFGGMVASYKAPSRRKLHGTMVGVSSFAVSPLVNLFASVFSTSAEDPFAALRTPGALLLTAILFVAVLAASYVGARRGETLYVHNEAIIRRQRSSKARRRLSEAEERA